MLGPDALTIAVSRHLGRQGVALVDWTVDELHGSTGRATAAVCRVRGRARTAEGEVLPWDITVKALRAPDSSDEDARTPQHWTYWKREALAYESALLPDGEDGLETVRCFGAFPDEGHRAGLAIALQTVEPNARWDLDLFGRAAALLGRWQARWVDHVPTDEWLARDQLRQRIARTDANGGLVEPDWDGDRVADAFPEEARTQLRTVWAGRWALIDQLSSCPSTLTHGDFSKGNLFACGDGRIVAVDWAALGVSPAGFDVAHLVMSAVDEVGGDTSPETIQSRLLGAYLDPFDHDVHGSVRRALATSIALTATSRLCWSLRRTVEPPVVAGLARLVPWIQANVDALR